MKVPPKDRVGFFCFNVDSEQPASDQSEVWCTMAHIKRLQQAPTRRKPLRGVGDKYLLWKGNQFLHVLVFDNGCTRSIIIWASPIAYLHWILLIVGIPLLIFHMLLRSIILHAVWRKKQHM